MKGTMLIVSPSGSIKTSPLTRPPETEEVQSAVGGWIEQVPRLDSIDYRGTIRTCVAFTNEEGKLKGMMVNKSAILLWGAALKRKGLPPSTDLLVGNLVVIFGDNELMSAL